MHLVYLTAEQVNGLGLPLRFSFISLLLPVLFSVVNGCCCYGCWGFLTSLPYLMLDDGFLVCSGGVLLCYFGLWFVGVFIRELDGTRCNPLLMDYPFMLLAGLSCFSGWLLLVLLWIVFGCPFLFWFFGWCPLLLLWAALWLGVVFPLCWGCLLLLYFYSFVSGSSVTVVPVVSVCGLLGLSSWSWMALNATLYWWLTPFCWFLFCLVLLGGCCWFCCGVVFGCPFLFCFLWFLPSAVADWLPWFPLLSLLLFYLWLLWYLIIHWLYSLCFSFCPCQVFFLQVFTDLSSSSLLGLGCSWWISRWLRHSPFANSFLRLSQFLAELFADG